ncbi:MAG TPA: GNAT family N-acetyltransferase [Rhizomicrobium sp.]|nr:GNAT family N-acetyltransferase [Rhizomicrobium sp.]
MTFQSRDEAFATAPRRPRRHDILALDLERLSRRFVIFTPSGKTIAEVAAMGARHIGAVAAPDIVERIVTHNPDNLWAIARRSRFDAAHPVAEGFYAFLMLNAEGLKRLSEGTFDGAHPNPALLSAQNERPAGIYAWAVCAPGGAAAALPLVMQKLATPLYKNIDMYANSATEEGARFFEAIGLRRGAIIKGQCHPGMFWLDRSGTEGQPLYDSYCESTASQRIGVSVVRSIEELMRVFTVRSAVYVAEQNCPYAEEFDGNDFCATHLLGYVGNEPAGCMRIRCFADFAKVERVAVRAEFRHSRLVHRLIRAAIALCRTKGYRRLYGQPRTDLLRFYRHFGFTTFPGSRILWFSGVEYTEVMLELERKDGALSIGADPYVLIRPEGRWHRPGVLEHSAERHPPRQGAPA